MTFYDAFTDELSKIAEEKDKLDAKERAARAIGLTGGAAAAAGLGAEMAGDISKMRTSERGKPRPKWSHPTKKWGARVKRGGMAALFPAAAYRVYRHYTDDKKDE